MSEAEKLNQEFAVFTGLTSTQLGVYIDRDQAIFAFALCGTFWLLQAKLELSSKRSKLVYYALIDTAKKIVAQEDVFGEEFSHETVVLCSQMIADHAVISVDDFNAKYREMAQNLGLDYVIRG